MGTISSLVDRLSRKSRPDLPPVTVTAFGFGVGPTFVAWQTVVEIRAFKVDRITTDEAFREFLANGQCLHVSEEQPGFDRLEAAMIAAFPTTADWRQSVLQPAFEPCRTLLYRRT